MNEERVQMVRDNVRKLIETKGTTIKAVAEGAGMSNRGLIKFLAFTNPADITLGRLFSVADALDVSPATLLVPLFNYDDCFPNNEPKN